MARKNFSDEFSSLPPLYISGGEKLFAMIKARIKARKQCCLKESDAQMTRMTRWAQEPIDECIYRDISGKCIFAMFPSCMHFPRHDLSIMIVVEIFTVECLRISLIRPINSIRKVHCRQTFMFKWKKCYSRSVLIKSISNCRQNTFAKSGIHRLQRYVRHSACCIRLFIFNLCFSL